MRTLRLLQLPASWMALLTSDPLEAGLHVLGGGLRPERLLRRYGLVVPEGEEQQQQQQQRGRRQPSGGASAARAAGALEGQEDEDEEEDDEQRARREDGAAADEAEEEDLDEALTRKLQGHWKAVVGFRPTGERCSRRQCWRAAHRARQETHKAHLLRSCCVSGASHAPCVAAIVVGCSNTPPPALPYPYPKRRLVIPPQRWFVVLAPGPRGCVRHPLL
jgi:hypothetical protein